MDVPNAEFVEDVHGHLHAPLNAHTVSIGVHKTPSTCYIAFIQICFIYYRIQAYKKSFSGMGGFSHFLAPTKWSVLTQGLYTTLMKALENSS